MNIMLDTNVMIDYIAVRQPWYQDVEQLWNCIAHPYPRWW